MAGGESSGSRGFFEKILSTLFNVTFLRASEGLSIHSVTRRMAYQLIPPLVITHHSHRRSFARLASTAFTPATAKSTCKGMAVC